jgi:hypothetical protein
MWSNCPQLKFGQSELRNYTEKGALFALQGETEKQRNVPSLNQCSRSIDSVTM